MIEAVVDGDNLDTGSDTQRVIYIQVASGGFGLALSFPKLPTEDSWSQVVIVAPLRGSLVDNKGWSVIVLRRDFITWTTATRNMRE